MAPTKKDADKGDKEAKLTPEQSAALILDYLRKQNRPYSATDISTNLKNRVTKSAATKLLKDMHERQEIEGKAAGKQIVYHAIQDEADEVDVDKLQEMGAETTRLRDETTALKVEEKELRLSLREGAAQIPLPELKAAVVTLEERKKEMVARLAVLKGGDVKPVTAEEREKVSVEYKKWMKCAGNRKQIRKDVWEMMTGEMEKGEKEELKESLGLGF